MAKRGPTITRITWMAKIATRRMRERHHGLKSWDEHGTAEDDDDDDETCKKVL